jgi:hypothetical protein
MEREVIEIVPSVMEEKLIKGKEDNKTICIRLRFMTNDLEISHRGKKKLACWDSGFASIEANKTLGIGSVGGQPFNTIEDIVPIIKEIFRSRNIYMASSNGRPRAMSPKRRKWLNG